MYRLTAIILLSSLSLCAQAKEYMPSLGRGDGPPTLGTISANALEPIDMLRHLFNAASIILGIYLIISAIENYFKHRQSPHEASLSTVIIGFILGLIFLALPFTYQLAKAGNQQLGLW